VGRTRKNVAVVCIVGIFVIVAGCGGSGGKQTTPPGSAPGTSSATPGQTGEATGGATAGPTAVHAGHWEQAALMKKPRSGLKLLALPDGSALAIGDGYIPCPAEYEEMCNYFPTADQSAMYADVWDPSTNRWGATSGLNVDRSNYAAIVLQTGRVLVAGGYAPSPYACYSSAKLYDPEQWTWTQTTGLMNWARCDPAYAMLSDGKVLLAGGQDIKENSLSNAEIYDPDTQKWTMVASMPSARVGGQAVTLKGGQVLVVGGHAGDTWEDLSSAVLYDPTSGKWSTVADLSAAPEGQLVALPDGGALMVENKTYDYEADKWILRASERFNPSTLNWTKVGPMMQAREWPVVTSLADGRVLVAGGVVEVAWPGQEELDKVSTLTATTDIFDPATNSWSAGPSMPDIRDNGAAVLLKDGSVLVAGGDLGEQGQPSTPGGWPMDCLASAVRLVP
jgi:hypothetical protein